MPAYAVIGAQWGDEGKGKVVDFLAQDAQCVVRYSGGSNAGHTVINEKGEFQLHLVPSGICWPQTSCVIGNGVVVDPDVLLREIGELKSQGVDTGHLYVSDRAHVIMPHHILLDRLEEEARGTDAIGTTGKGVGPAYVDKTSRIGIRMGDLIEPDYLLPRLKHVLEIKNKTLALVYGCNPLSLDEELERCLFWKEHLQAHITATEVIIEDTLARDEKLLLEGAQGTMLDLDHGTYPFVTSSSPSIGGACVGAGLNPGTITGVTGIFKAYCTRVGSGPLPTEMDDATGDPLRESAGEYGATTGRPRRLGWFDAVAGQYSVRINGFTSLVLTRLDILDALPMVKICTGYRIDGQETKRFPASLSQLERCKPIYEEMPGWDRPTAGTTNLSQLPTEAKNYLKRIEELVGCPFHIVSTGPRRGETIVIQSVI
jgi:adenylosuccinate synthase